MRGDIIDDGMDIVAVRDIQRPGFCNLAFGDDLASR